MNSKWLQELRGRHHACSNANEVVDLALEAERLKMDGGSQVQRELKHRAEQRAYAAEREAERLRAYAAHKMRCDSQRDSGGPCTCGLVSALAGTEAGNE